MSKKSKKQKNSNSADTTVKKKKSVSTDKSILENSQPVETVDTSKMVTVTPTDVEATIDELAATPKRERIWEVDFVRGLMILFVIWDHFMWDVNHISRADFNTKLFQWLFELSKNYYAGALRAVTHDAFVTMFIFTSGVSSSFSRSNGKRALKMCIFAGLFTAVTYGLSAALSTELTIYFNVIHVVALSVLIYSGIEWIWSKLNKNWQKNVFGVVMFALIMTVLVLGYSSEYLIKQHIASPYFEGNGAYRFHWINLLFGESQWRTDLVVTFRSGGDYWSFLPDFGWFLVGAFVGRALYRERKSLFPSVNPKFVSPITFLGRYSLWVYFISQVVMYGFIYLLHVMFPIL